MKNTIAYLCNSKSWGGLEMNQIRNAHWMKKRGHQVFVFVIRNSKAHQFAKSYELDVIFFSEHKRHYDFIAAWRLFKELKKLNIQILVVRGTFDMSIAASVSFLSRRKIKTIFCMEMQLSFPKKQFFRTWRYHFLDAWCCPLPYLKSQVLQNTHVHPDKVHLIPSGIDFDLIKLIDKAAARRIYQISQDKIVFGILGRIDPKKGQHIAIEAFGKLNIENGFLLIQGELNESEHADYLELLKNQIQRSSLGNQIQLASFHQDVNSFYSAIDYLIVPSENETVGMVTLEAIARGITILGSDVGGTKDILENGKWGRLFLPNSSEDLSAKMKSIIDEKFKIERESLIELGKYFDKDKTCVLMEELIQKLISPKK